MSNSKLLPYLEALFAVIVWGASFIATKVALQSLSPITIVWLRFLIGVAILGLVVILRKQFTLPEKKEWGYFALLGFLGITFHQWLQSNALQTSEAGTTAWIVSTTPVFMALLGWFLLKERLDWIKNLGILLAFLGVLVVVSKGDLGSISIGRFGAPGDVLVLISAVNWAVFSALSRHRPEVVSGKLDDVLSHGIRLGFYHLPIPHNQRHKRDFLGQLRRLDGSRVLGHFLFRAGVHRLVRCLESLNDG